jgi:hypothetical protein
MVGDGVRRRHGALLVLQFHITSFVTRSDVAGIARAGIASPRIQAIWSADEGEVSVQ